MSEINIPLPEALALLGFARRPGVVDCRGQLSMVRKRRPTALRPWDAVRASTRATSRMTILAQGDRPYRVSLVPLPLRGRSSPRFADRHKGCHGGASARWQLQERTGVPHRAGPSRRRQAAMRRGQLAPSTPCHGVAITTSPLMPKARIASRTGRGAMMQPVDAVPLAEALSPWMKKPLLPCPL